MRDMAKEHAAVVESLHAQVAQHVDELVRIRSALHDAQCELASSRDVNRRLADTIGALEQVITDRDETLMHHQNESHFASEQLAASRAEVDAISGDRDQALADASHWQAKYEALLQ